MHSENSCNLWVFREGRTTLRGHTALAELRAMFPTDPSAPPDEAVDALLRAGEMECALADCGAADALAAAAVTSGAAAALVRFPGYGERVCAASKLLDRIAVPETISVSPPEGFAYYAVHPLDFAAVADQVTVKEGTAAVIGIRSIGTTLSAMVAAALLRRGIAAERVTVRPRGHPYDRRTTFSPEQLRWIAERRAASAEFLVVDEGPGISGSSFLSVGDALLAAGVERERIWFLGSRVPDVDGLAAKDGAARWRSFRFVAAKTTTQLPAKRASYLGGGEWRRRYYGETSHWPASWIQMERLKFLSVDTRTMYKFHGLGRYGQDVAERARLVGESGYSPRMLNHSCGFTEFEVVPGQPMNATQISAAVLERVADYCALRVFEFGAAPEQESELDSMVRFNVGESFGPEAAGELARLAIERPVIADGRMLPHEWIATPDGLLWKTDAATHGDDHFFPGPVDIAWDLAGAIVEWGMSREASRYMLDRYRQRSGDDAEARVNSYVFAYSVFRMAYCAMGAFALRGSDEAPRLRRAAAHYRNLVEAHLKASGFRRPAASGDRNGRWGDRSAGIESVLALRKSDADAA